MVELKKETSQQSLVQVSGPVSDLCTCRPLSPLHTVAVPDEDGASAGRLVLATQPMQEQLCSLLDTFFSRQIPLSLLLLHVSQLEHVHISPETAILHKRQRYHAPETFLEQTLVNISRAIRGDDQILVHSGANAAILLPGVDQQGVYRILERVDRAINLLQAETVIPPLKRETDIVLGIGSYSGPGATPEQMFAQLSEVAWCFTLRPVISSQLWTTRSTDPALEALPHRSSDDLYLSPGQTHNSGIPFMQLPRELPHRLKQLLPYAVALELRCVPVGRDHHCLTIAMADPTNSAAVSHLHEMTGMTIFPVSCETEDLDMLLEKKW
jgi:hypothetical protein